MGSNSHIEWTESTWNPVTGCSKISPGCKNCYAERMAIRLHAMGQLNYKNGFNLTMHESALDLPLRWKKPQTIFVNSMSDLFHKDVPLKFIQKIFSVMRQAYWHRFQILTKRSERLSVLNKELLWAPNIWMGVSVETHAFLYRIAHLKQTNAPIKFLSLEPLLGPVGNMHLNGIDWVIVGGESGPYARPMKAEWVVDIKNQCQRNNTPFFFKQWGGLNKKKTGRLLEGQTWNQMPKDFEKKMVKPLDLVLG